MRFIRGDSLKEAIERFHADTALRTDPGRRSLELRKLLRRFLDACNVIEYAHSRGVLHRDIKPGNVIVGRHGETLVVDWGLAKATGKSDPSSGERTLRPSSASGSAETLPGSALGTPAYMSPEQAEGNLEALGPRSDVYSLGATLYSLLTGRPPFAGEPGEVLRAVQRGEFRPPRALDPAIDRALEAVCLKAMTLRPGDRYGTCRALAEDIERWMADEPVAAWREPLSRRLRRWARRHRTAVAGAVAALLAGLIGLAAVATVQARANTTLGAKNLQLTEEKKKTEEALAESEESRQQAEAVSRFLVEAFRSPDPTQDGRQVKVVDVLDRASAQLDHEFGGSPATRGALLNALGNTYRGLGLYDQAVTVYTKVLAVRESALGPDHADTLASRSNLGVAYWFAGRLPEAIALHEGTLQRLEAKLGPDHPATLNSRTSLAVAYWSAGRLDEAIALHKGTLKRREVKLGPDHPATLASRSNLALAYYTAGRVSEAIVLHEATLKLKEAKLGPDHPDTLTDRGNLAAFYRAAGRLSEAIALHEGTIQRLEAKLGPDHPDTLNTRANLANAYAHAGRMAKAEGLYREVLARRRKTLKPDSPLLANDLTRLGRILLENSRWSEAEPLFREALVIRTKATPDDWARYDVMSVLGDSLLGQGRYAEAEPLLVAGYEGIKAREARTTAQEKVRLREAAERVIRLYESWGKTDQAAAWKTKLGCPTCRPTSSPGPEPTGTRIDFQLLLMDLAMPADPFARSD
jgi:tetratricopeptide (TPR) repeat protein